MPIRNELANWHGERRVSGSRYVKATGWLGTLAIHSERAVHRRDDLDNLGSAGHADLGNRYCFAIGRKNASR